LATLPAGGVIHNPLSPADVRNKETAQRAASTSHITTNEKLLWRVIQ